ncbi:MAG: 23S rRNA (guanosine(2251)-2'-O)-methyltransferase RlmB [Leptospira sp.]|nr:23S rRNA (guanosine(2251)-2'-O)-methyltransferase RlmB [Leptospira sp.]
MEKKLAYKNAVFGRRNVSELLRKLSESGDGPETWPVREVLIKKNPSTDIINEIVSVIPKGLKITYLSGGDLDSMLPGINHQGVIALKIARATNAQTGDLSDLKVFIKESKGPVLILDRIQDTGNLGNILRTAECFGVTAVVISERESADITATVEKSSSGAVHHLNLFRVTNLMQAVEALKASGYWIVSASDRGTEDWKKLPDATETVLILGNESEGVKKILLDNSDFILRIPLHGSVSSLNVGTACGICLDRIVNRT